MHLFYNFVRRAVNKYTTQAGAFANQALQKVAAELELSAAANGTDIDTRVAVYENDGSKNWAGELTKYLCTNPKDATKQRAELACIVARLLGVLTFDPNRLSRKDAISAKAKDMFVIPVLKSNGYSMIDINTGLDIAKAVAAGKVAANVISLDSQIKVDVDGISVLDPRKLLSARKLAGDDGWTKYPYVSDPSASTDLFWHRVMVQMPTRNVRLVDFLAIRGMGINEFISLDEAAHRVAMPRQAKRRTVLNAACKI
jgi:hypothetical protein